MCGITGIYSFNKNVEQYSESVKDALSTLNKRGPDFSDSFCCNKTILGHSRLSILDTSAAGNQPFTDISGNFTIVFNGEIYNYRDFYNELKNDGIKFKSTSDTEVLLYLFIKYGKKCLEMLNGFFAFAIYNKNKNSVFIARDRVGIKPLYYGLNEDFLCFSSEMKGIMKYPIKRELNFEALEIYLQLNYIPAPLSILENIYKLEPGQYIEIKNNTFSKDSYYSIPFYSEENTSKISYEETKKQLVTKINDAVKLRLISDVPLGTFLSGGIDSSIISTIASKYVNKLQTFSIGFTDNAFFDETQYANLVAKKIKSQHTVITVTNRTLEENISSVLDSIDEPFADSSAIAVYILCKEVKPHVTVALSGDGADEVFSGYNKHRAHYNLINKKSVNEIISTTSHIIKHLPKSRNNKIGNTFRKIDKYAQVLGKSNTDAYLQLCSINLNHILAKEKSNSNFLQRTFTSHFSENFSLNDVLVADQKLVLANDMLTKVDRMSMANSLEVRTPFLDHNMINFANNLHPDFKTNKELKKRILQDSFKDVLPEELYNRKKQGFEVPLYHWCKSILQKNISEFLNKKFIESQGIFNYSEIEKIIQKLHSPSPEDSPAQIWGLLVFQIWWKKYIEENA